MPRSGDIDNSYPEKLKTIGITLLEEFCGAKKHHKMKCDVCNYEWIATPISKLQNFKKWGRGGCPECTQKEQFQETRKQNIQIILDRGFEILSDYNGSRAMDREGTSTSITVKNKTCGHVFTTDAKNFIARNINCPTCNNAVKRAKFQQFNIDRSVEYMKTAELWDQYRHKVYMATRRTYYKYSSIINPNNLPRGLAGQEGAYHLDHKVPVRWCFEHYVPVNICAHVDNLQMLHWLENLETKDNIKEDVEIPPIFKPYI